MSNLASEKGLLVGGTGMLGDEVRRALELNGVPYRLMVRRQKEGLSVPDGSEIVLGDLMDADAVMRAAKGMAWIVYVPTNDREKTIHARHLVAAAKAGGVRLICKTSAILAGETPPLSFGIEHVEAEQSIMQSGIDWIVLRPSVFMQALQMFSTPMRKSGKLIMPVPTGEVAFVDTRDIGEAVAVCLKNPGAYLGQALPITGPAALPIKEVVAGLSEASGKQIKHMTPPRFIARLALRFGEGMDAWMVKRLLQLFKALEAGKEGTVSPHLSKILGREPTSFAEFLKRDTGAQTLWE